MMSVEIFAIDGKLIQINQINDKLNYIDVSGLAGGNYLVKIKQKETLIYSGKILLD